ncbi:hypothetical protein T12_2158, partial [Trichinella patagoniensis]
LSNCNTYAYLASDSMVGDVRLVRRVLWCGIGKESLLKMKGTISGHSDSFKGGS